MFNILIKLKPKVTKIIFCLLIVAVLWVMVNVDPTIAVSGDDLITTVAGTGIAGYSGDGGVASDAQLKNPNGVAVDISGNLYIADRYNNRIRKVDINGTITTVAGTGVMGDSGDGGAASAAQLKYPVGVAVDGEGNVYIADTYNHRVRKVDTTGTITTVAGTGVGGYSGDGGGATSAQLKYPTRITLNSEGLLYIVDNNNHRVRKVDASGTITTVAGNGVAGYSGDSGAAAGAQLNYPIGIAVDSEGNLFITDSLNHRVRKVDTAGLITTVAGNGISGFSGDGGAATGAQLNNPNGVVVDNEDNLYIADDNNHRIRMVDIHGIITTVVGTGVSGHAGDGEAASEALLNNPKGMAVDNSGNLYIADYNNHRIRKVIGEQLQEITAATATLTRDGVPETVEVIKTAANQFEGNLISRSDTEMFTHLTIQASSSVDRVNLQLQVAEGVSLEVEEPFINGTAVIDVHEKLGSLDTGEPGISLQYMRQSADANGDYQIAGTMVDIHGNQSSITVMLHLGVMDSDSVTADKEALAIIFGGSDTAVSVTENLTLATIGANGTVISWLSSNTDVIANDGTVTRPVYLDGDATVTLTATVTKGSASETREFAVTVIKLPISDSESVTVDLADLEISFAGSDTAASVTVDLTLPTSGSQGTIISWSSSDPAVVSNAGEVTRPAYLDGEATVTLTATVTKGSASGLKNFIVTVLKRPPTEVWVDDDFAEGNAGGHAWGLDAFANLTAAVDAVASGGTVHVHAGAYQENLVVSTAGITIENANDDDITVQANSGAAPTITLDGENITVSGLTVAGGSVGIQVNAAGATITGNTIQDNITGLELNAVATVTANTVSKNNNANIVVADGGSVETAANTRGPVLNDYPIASMLANADTTVPAISLVYDTGGNVNLGGGDYVVFAGDDTFQTTIRVTSIDSLGFGSLVLNFDPTALQVDQITSLLPDDTVSVTENTYDNSSGSINFSFALQSGAANLTGSGANKVIDLAAITFTATDFDNQANLQVARFSYDDLETRLTRQGTTTTERLDFTLPPLDDLHIIEQVDLDGSAGITFKDWLKHTAGFSIGLTRNGQAAGSVTTTANSTAYAFSNLVEGDYLLTASGSGYRTSTQAITVAKTVTQAAQANPQVLQITGLVAGDVVSVGEGITLGSDGFISTEDLARVAAHYREEVDWATATEELKACDLDRDGKVTIDDIAYVIMNWFEINP